MPETEDQSSLRTRPFFKWAGGKTQLLEPISELVPNTISSTSTYYEPFIGGGAVFFALGNRFTRAVINDWNPEIVTTYQVVRDSTPELIALLNELQERYQKAPESSYLEERAKNPDDMTPLHRAARFLFLNRTGFNGLYRVNGRGQFNVPWGRGNPKIVNEPRLMACAKALRSVLIQQGDFANAVNNAHRGDVVYFDPPYVPISSTSSFTSYTREGFPYADHQRLAACCQDLVQRGVTVIASNSDTEVVRDLYCGFELRQVPARRAINSKGGKRGPIMELLIVGRRG